MITAFVYTYQGERDTISDYGLVEFDALPRMGEVVYLSNDLNDSYVVEMVTHHPDSQSYKFALYLNGKEAAQHFAQHVNATL